MAWEIERKFLVQGDHWKQGTLRTLRQGYLSRTKEQSVRVRSDGAQAQLTIKGTTQGMTRVEYEYPIPLDDANQMLDTLCLRPLIEKRRYVVDYAGKRWEVDEFLGENAGLVVAEIELEHEAEAFERPPWLGPEVTDDPRYLNANLSLHPYSTWQNAPTTHPSKDTHTSAVSFVTYLEMHNWQATNLVAPSGVCIEPVSHPSVDQYLQLYRGVGDKWQWVDRLRMPREQLAAQIGKPGIEIHRLTVDGEPAGYVELDFEDASNVEIVYFGLYPNFIGRGLGKLLLDWTLNYVWSRQPRRVWLHTCDRDHAAALPNYLRAGFQVYDRRVIGREG